MSDREPADAMAGVREVRVHGVGGPQARKILGVLDDTDTETLRLPAPPRQDGLFADTKSRIVRRVGEPTTVAYEWGGLTLGSLLNALWAVYLPLTFLNVAGWSGRPGAGRRNRAVVHVLCALGTLTYVAWIGYLLLDVVGRQWRDRLVASDLPGWADAAVRRGGLPLAHAVFAGVLAALWVVNRRSGACFEGVTAGEAVESWDEQGQVVDPAFFGHARSYERLRSRHEALALGGALAAVGLGFVPRHLATAPGSSLTSIGVAIVVLALVQGLLLVGLWVACRWAGSVPQAVFATVGTVLCHAAFAGVAITAGARLSRWPTIDPARPIVAGPELGFGDFFFLALALGVASCAVFAWTVHRRGGAAAGYGEPRKLRVALVGSANTMGALVSVSFAALLVVLIGLQWSALDLRGPATWWGSSIHWYEHYRAGQNAAQKLGGLALASLALALVAVLRRPRQGGLARVLGNVWDVLTFWPRRFHPFAVPPYAERAVPELRASVRHLRRHDAALVVLGHSQGSVLAFTALAEELAADPGGGPVSLLTFGSPLGVLYEHAFPAYFDGVVRATVAERIHGAGGRWWNVYRSTDPIGGPLCPAEAGVASEHWFDKWLPDPRQAAVANPVPVPPPLERARPWGSADGHNFYLADPAVRRMGEWLRSGAPVTAADLEALEAE
jgi:hypothetical protein